MKKCNFCGLKNTEVAIHKFKPVSVSGWIGYILTLGLIKHRLCQTCASRVFRNFKKGI